MASGRAGQLIGSLHIRQSFSPLHLSRLQHSNPGRHSGAAGLPIADCRHNPPLPVIRRNMVILMAFETFKLHSTYRVAGHTRNSNHKYKLVCTRAFHLSRIQSYRCRHT